MSYLLYILTKVIYFLISALELAMFLRALLSWFIPNDGNTFYQFLISITEPIIAPIRALVERSSKLASFPFDLSFIITYILLLILRSFLI